MTLRRLHHVAEQWVNRSCRHPLAPLKLVSLIFSQNVRTISKYKLSVICVNCSNSLMKRVSLHTRIYF